MKHIIVPALSIALLTFTHSVPPARSAQPVVDRPTWTPIECPMEIPAGYQVGCGMVVVPEDYGNPNSPAIQLAVAIVHQVPEGVLYRVLGEPNPRDQSNAIEPTLEDSYIWLMHQARDASQEDKLS